MKKKIIMVLTNGFDPDIRVYKEAQYLASTGHSVEVLCWDRENRYPNERQKDLDGFKIIRFFEYSKYGSGFKQILAMLRFKKDCKTYIKNSNIKYDYIHCHDLDGMIIGKMICPKKTKLVFDMHEYYVNKKSKMINVLIKKIVNYLQNTANKIIYVNNHQINSITKKNQKKLIYLPNYPIKKSYVPIEKIQSNKIRVNYIGAVRDVQSLMLLTKLDKEKYDVGIYGIGAGLNNLIIESKKYDNINIYGKYDGIRESGIIYQNTDILYCVYNPNNDNWRTALPIKLYEAIITQTPIIVSNNTIAGDFVEKYGIGKNYDYNNEESLNEVVDDIVLNYQKYKDNIKKISDNYIWERQVKELNKIY